MILQFIHTFASINLLGDSCIVREFNS